MKLRMVSFLLITILMLSLASCFVTSKETHVAVSCEGFRDNPTGTRNEFTIEVGDKVYVELCSNPTTGFKWSYEMTGNPSVIEEDYDFQKPVNDLTGSPGIEKWKFEGIEKGTARIMMEYGQPWDGGIKKEWIYQLTITVE